jgi:hypothetical protein
LAYEKTPQFACMTTPRNLRAAVQKLAMDRIRQDIGEYNVCKVAEDLNYEAVDMHIIADPKKAVESRDW